MVVIWQTSRVVVVVIVREHSIANNNWLHSILAQEFAQSHPTAIAEM